MRKRVDTHTVNTFSFRENVEFSMNTPHSIRIKHFPYDEIVPLHYADTIEILVVKDVEGRITLGRESRAFLPRDVIVIPPYCVHATNCKQCDGELLNFKISIENLKAYLDINAIIRFANKQIFGKRFVPELYDEIYPVMQRIIEEDENIFSRIHCILEIVEMLARVNDDAAKPPLTGAAEEEHRLRKLIRWTHEHCCEHITLDMAAAQMNMSKYYLCKFFRQYAHMTYVTYLNQVRLETAAQMLLMGKNVTETAMDCGFESVSYFVQLFKRVVGCTPGQYVKGKGLAGQKEQD